MALSNIARLNVFHRNSYITFYLYKIVRMVENISSPTKPHKNFELYKAWDVRIGQFQSSYVSNSPLWV